MFSRKGLLLILDGLGDRPVEDLEGQTPLEAAHTPVMDRLAAEGMSGFVAHLTPGVPVGTQTGSGLLLGLAPSDAGKLTRGLVQAVGAGIELREGDIALRSNFASLQRDDGFVRILDRRAGRITGVTAQLAEAINEIPMNDGARIFVKASTQHRVALVLRGENLSEAITDTDPGAGEEDAGLLACRPLQAADEAALRTASLINDFLARSHDILKSHPINIDREAQGLPPANGLITRGAGRMADLKNLMRHLDIKTAVVSGEGTLHGLGRLFGFSVIVRPGFTAAIQTDLDGKVAAALEALHDHDLVIVHIKGPDLCAHDHDPIGKKKCLEAIDAALEPLLLEDLVIGISGDHSTDSMTGKHTGDPVPSLLASRFMRKDTLQTFGESSCMKGGLGCLSPIAFLCTMLDQMNRMHNFRSHEIGFFK